MQENLDGILLEGFSEPFSVEILRENRYSGVPKNPGIYIVMRISDSRPEFLPISTGGAFKGKNPSCGPEMILDNWVDGAHVAYVGMARRSLHERLKALIDFGYGKRAGHWGGRLLWHLPDMKELLVRWRTCGAAREAERAAMTSFKNQHDGRRPFANLMD